MEQAEEAGLSGEEVDQQLGELYALRALFHFDLALLYAKLPSTVSDLNNELGITLATQTFPADYIGERASLAKTYETIFSDIDTALQNWLMIRVRKTDISIIGELWLCVQECICTWIKPMEQTIMF